MSEIYRSLLSPTKNIADTVSSQLDMSEGSFNQTLLMINNDIIHPLGTTFEQGRPCSKNTIALWGATGTRLLFPYDFKDFL